MSKIADIRFYESATVDGRFLHQSTGTIYHFQYKELAKYILQIVMKLRELDFQMERDHLYITLTPSLDDGVVELAAPSKFKEEKRIQPVYMGVNPDAYNSMAEEEKVLYLFNCAVKIVSAHFSPTPEVAKNVAQVGHAIVNQKESFEIKYKEIINVDLTAQVIVNIVDFNSILPIVRILCSGNITAEFKLPAITRDMFLQQFGQLSLSKKAVTIKPRTGFIAKRYNLTQIVLPIQ